MLSATFKKISYPVPPMYYQSRCPLPVYQTIRLMEKRLKDIDGSK